MKRIEFRRLEEFFIHKKLRTPVDVYGKAVALMYALLATTLISSFYGIYYEMNHYPIPFIKHLADIIAIVYCPIGLLILKYKGDTKLTIFSMLTAATVLVFLSTYFCGGIYALDLFWMTIICIVGVLFIGMKGGVFLVGLALTFILVFYQLNAIDFKDFKKESEILGVNYTLYNLFFLLGLASFISYFFVNEAQKTKQKLDLMKEKEVMDLDTKYRFITENVDEIISLHLENGDSTYISPSIQAILGYEPHEMVGSTYFEWIGKSFQNREIRCSTKNGKHVWLEVTFDPIQDEIGSGEVYISMAKDVSEKVLENQRITILRKQIANDFHDEMGNKLASITLNSSILGLKVTENPLLSDMISKIEDTSKSLYEHSRDFIWSLDSKSDQLREIFAYIRDFGEDFLHPLQINFLVESEGFSEQRKIVLPMYWGRHIILICKEVLTNAAKHSKCKTVILSLQIEESQYIISIKDDGIGIPSNVKTGRGLQSIKERAKNIDCRLLIDTTNVGTQISLIGKLPKLGEGNV